MLGIFLEDVGELLHLWVQGLELFALTIQRRFALPWPITIAAMFPVGAVALAVVV
jgi:hypothetical protein